MASRVLLALFATSIAAASGAERASADTVTGAIVNEAGLCLDVHAPEMRANGGRVQVWACNGEPQQRWIVDAARGRIQNEGGGLCLDVHAPELSQNGGRVQIWGCNDQPQQRWTVSQDGAIRAGSGLCLDIHAPDLNRNGGRVQIWGCNGETQQRWSIVSATPAASAPGEIIMTLPADPARRPSVADLFPREEPAATPNTGAVVTAPSAPPAEESVTFNTGAVVEARPSPPPEESVVLNTGTSQVHEGLSPEDAFYGSPLFDCTAPRVISERQGEEGGARHHRYVTCVGRAVGREAWMLVGEPDYRPGSSEASRRTGGILFDTPPERLTDNNPFDFGRGWNWFRHTSLFRPICSDRFEKPHAGAVPRENYRRCVLVTEEGRLAFLTPVDGTGRPAGLVGSAEGGARLGWSGVSFDDYHWRPIDRYLHNQPGRLASSPECFSTLDRNQLPESLGPLDHGLWNNTDFETGRQATHCFGLFEDGRIRVIAQTDWAYGFSDRTRHNLPVAEPLNWTELGGPADRRYIRRPECAVWDDRWNTMDVRCFTMVEGGDVIVSALVGFAVHPGWAGLGRPPGAIQGELECEAQIGQVIICLAVSDNGGVYALRYRPDEPETAGWVRLPDPPSPPASAPSCAPVQGREFACAILGADGTLYLSDVSATLGASAGGSVFATSWSSVGAPPWQRITSAPECVSSDTARVDCFVRGEDGELWLAWADPSEGRNFGDGWVGLGAPDGQRLQ